MTRKTVNHRRPPTMQDVARLAGVSQPTVSRVLNQSTTSVPISEETRARVLQAVERLGYRPNVIARSLRTQRTQMIALLIADITNAFYYEMARAVQAIARQAGYEVLLSFSDHSYKNELHFCEIVSRRSLDGMIIVPYYLTSEDLNRVMEETHAPITVLGQHIQHPNIDVAYVDDERALYEATRWLITERGYRSFGFLGVSETLPPGPRRFRGFQRALDESGIALDACMVVQGDFTMESGSQAARKLLGAGKLPRALVVLNDLMAIGAILAFQEAGYRVPEDIAVIGFDDIPQATIVRPTLTTIAQDPHEIGEKLARSLFERIENPSLQGRRLFESTYRLVPRQSA